LKVAKDAETEAAKLPLGPQKETAVRAVRLARRRARVLATEDIMLKLEQTHIVLEEDGTFRCDLCDYSEFDEDGLAAHRRSLIHKKAVIQKVKDNPDLGRIREKKKESPYGCKLCQKIFTSADQELAHKKGKKHMKKLKAAKILGRISADATDLDEKSHVRIRDLEDEVAHLNASKEQKKRVKAHEKGGNVEEEYEEKEQARPRSRSRSKDRYRESPPRRRTRSRSRERRASPRRSRSLERDRSKERSYREGDLLSGIPRIDLERELLQREVRERERRAEIERLEQQLQRDRLEYERMQYEQERLEREARELREVREREKAKTLAQVAARAAALTDLELLKYSAAASAQSARQQAEYLDLMERARASTRLPPLLSSGTRSAASYLYATTLPSTSSRQYAALTSSPPYAPPSPPSPSRLYADLAPKKRTFSDQPPVSSRDYSERHLARSYADIPVSSSRLPPIPSSRISASSRPSSTPSHVSSAPSRSGSYSLLGQPYNPYALPNSPATRTAFVPLFPAGASSGSSSGPRQNAAGHRRKSYHDFISNKKQRS